MNPPPALAPQQQPQLNLNNIVQLLQQNPGIHRYTDSNSLPAAIGVFRNALFNYGLLFGKFSDELIAISSGNIASTPTIYGIEHIREEIHRLDLPLDNSIETCLKGLTAVMAVLESTNSLSIENKIAFEELERLARDIKGDLMRVKVKLEGL